MKKIMFNDKYGLTQAVLEGRKTQTRRAIKLKDGEYVNVVALDNGSFMSYIAKEGNPTAHVGALEMPNYVQPLTPKYFIGEEVAVAQSYVEVLDYNFLHEKTPSILNEPILRDNSYKAGKENKMFVKSEYMPHRIKITNNRVERLQDISDEDCIKEGVKRNNERYIIENEKGVVFYTNSPLLAFRYLIDKVSGKGTWESNPWVFVYDFELIR